jgi:hypothetical protein
MPYILTEDPERLARDTGQLLAPLRVFQETGVRLEFRAAEGQARLASLNVYLAAVPEYNRRSTEKTP